MFGNKTFTPEELQLIQAALDTKLGVKEVSFRPGPDNSVVAYLSQSKAVQQANALFGPGGWSSSVTQVTVDFVEQEANGTFSCCCSGIVRITLKDGTHREDVGTGFAQGQATRQDALDLAKKTACTDALKRALRLFGDGLGNSIADKAWIAEVSKSSAEYAKASIAVIQAQHQAELMGHVRDQDQAEHYDPMHGVQPHEYVEGQ